MSSRRDHERHAQAEAPRVGRRSRNSHSRFDTSSLATVRELMKEIRRLEDEVCMDEVNQIIYGYRSKISKKRMGIFWSGTRMCCARTIAFVANLLESMMNKCH